MFGNIEQIINYSYGFIYTEEGQSVFFHKSQLRNCSINQIEEGDAVEFIIGRGDNGKNQALNIRKRYQSAGQITVANPGLHPTVKENWNHFNSDEKQIIKSISTVFYVTNSGGTVQISGSIYRYFLIKPTEYFNRAFQLNRELVVIFADYVNFEPRSLDVADRVYQKVESKLRLDRGCYIIISHDECVEEKLTNILRDSNVNQIIVPFTYKEMQSASNIDETIKTKFRKYLFDTDIFLTSKPIQDDIFFFGRRDYLQDIVSKCKNSTHSGIFGLRRSGKTSMLHGVKNQLRQQGYPIVFISCESELSNLDWQSALCKVVLDVYNELNIDDKNILESDYKLQEVSTYFEEDMNTALEKLNHPITIMFDEIEAITFGVAQGEKSDDKWLDGKNFVKFWNQIKGYYTKYPRRMSILVAGTNPTINDTATIGGNRIPNPMFGQLSASNQGAYLPAFANDDTRNMVNTLGGYMGLSFDDYTVSRLTSDCGGHPYLMRILCSHINKYVRDINMTRPCTISRAVYDKSIPEFEITSEATNFFLMILNILMTSYENEYNALKYIALGQDNIISQTHNSDALQHLIGYGLIEDNQGNYAIRYSSVSRFLRDEYKFERQGMSVEEQKEEITARINKAEMGLRKIVRNTLRMNFGLQRAKQLVISAMNGYNSITSSDIRKAEQLDYNQLFDTSENKMYFGLLQVIILNNINAFSNIFEDQDDSIIRKHLGVINFSRRCPDHSFTEDSVNWSEEKFISFRQSISWLESFLKNYD